MPDQSSRRRRFQFRLRTLLIVVTLLAGLCGWAADHARMIHELDDMKRRLDTTEHLTLMFLRGGFTGYDTGVLEFRPNTRPEVIEEARRLLPKMTIKVSTAK
jgi:hypothetical protein